jgi:hypothetical protein
MGMLSSVILRGCLDNGVSIRLKGRFKDMLSFSNWVGWGRKFKRAFICSFVFSSDIFNIASFMWDGDGS